MSENKTALLSLAGRRLVITGAGSGIGRATAELAALAGADHLILVGRRREALQGTAARIAERGLGTRVAVVEADVTIAADRAKIWSAANKVSAIDGLVNNAGLFTSAPLGATTDEQWNETVAVNLTAPFSLLRDLRPLLARGKDPSVVQISSTLAVKPIPGASAYNASKAGLVQLTRTLALELAPEGIRVNAILPGIVETPMYAGRFTSDHEAEAGLKAAAKLHPLGRIGRPEDIAQAAAFLLSPAAAWITGVALPVDGGMLVT